jgi:hypothetical protein
MMNPSVTQMSDAHFLCDPKYDGSLLAFDDRARRRDAK